MADSTITDLAEATTLASNDLLVLVDLSDTSMDGSGTDKKCTIATLGDKLAEFTWRDISGAYTVVDADIGNGLNATAAAAITIPNSLTRLGSVIVKAGSTGDVSIAAGSGVTLDKPGGRDTISTQYQTMATIPVTLTHYVLSGAEA